MRTCFCSSVANDVTNSTDKNSNDYTINYGDSNFMVEMDARTATPGVHYKLCVDKDGANGPLTYGDTKLRVYVSPVTSAAKTIVYESPEKTMFERLLIECDSDSLGNPLCIHGKPDTECVNNTNVTNLFIQGQWYNSSVVLSTDCQRDEARPDL